jgi:hypothetical protein
MKRKHAELIHAWADGAEIEVFQHDYWYTVELDWDDDYEYRIKQAKPSKLDVLRKTWEDASNAYWAELNKEIK